MIGAFHYVQSLWLLPLYMFYCTFTFFLCSLSAWVANNRVYKNEHNLKQLVSRRQALYSTRHLERVRETKNCALIARLKKNKTKTDANVTEYGRRLDSGILHVPAADIFTPETTKESTAWYDKECTQGAAKSTPPIPLRFFLHFAAIAQNFKAKFLPTYSVVLCAHNYSLIR